ncbi:molecular chaperone HtpG [Niabella terrae]
MLEQEKGNISIHTENIFPIIKKFLYSDHEIFLRELVSNAVDAIQKAKRLVSLGQFNGTLGEPLVQVKVDKEARTITISDNGIGMTAEEVKKYINQVAFSGASEFLEKFKEAKDAHEIIGQFGLGFYSAFMVADTVEIQSLSYQQDADPVKWVCDGSTSYELSEGSRSQRGTDIILHINEENSEFLEDHKLQEILNKYGKFLPVPIQFGMKKESEPDGEDEEGKPKYKEVERPNIINTVAPIWTKPPSELKDEDYLNFYQELYPFTEPPLFWIHLNVDYPFNLTGILYFPKIKNDIEMQRNKIKLFSRQVFITDDVKDIVPEFLMLLQGVIDSPDIPLNVSRSFLQADGNVKKINTYITRKVADKLAELFKNDRKSYEEKWSDVGVFVKYGAISEPKFWERAKDFILLQNTAKAISTLPEYREKVAASQTDKDGNIIYLYTPSPDKQDSYIQAANNKGYDVLLLDGPLDNHFVSFLERELEKTQIKRVDADVIEKLIDKDEKIESSLSEEQTKELESVYKEAIQKPGMEVVVENLAAEAMPVTVTMDEFSRRMKDMAAMGGGMSFYGAMPDRYKVAVNANNPLATRILAESGADARKALAQQAFDLALLAQGLLTGPELTAFVARSVKMI